MENTANVKKHFCPFCHMEISIPEYNWQYYNCTPGCSKISQAYEIKGILNWYKYPITTKIYLSAFEE